MRPNFRWKSYTVLKHLNGVRLIERHGPYAVWLREIKRPSNPNARGVVESVIRIHQFEEALFGSRRRCTRLVNQDGTPTPRLAEWWWKNPGCAGREGRRDDLAREKDQ
jgi:hypothetical protein